ncbi:MAG TPA: dihydrolipoyl dehydrogenase [Acholeplasmataceae bacterium]|jgi:dihydrolipoamide dehydrogenase|nr:dihydrolipoyl dehydrogenase [Acholeplasmataceae bacterium]
MKDVIIIGAGPGGYETALRAAKQGLSVLLIEKDKLGGTCLQRGCIPTKAYYQSAAVLRQLKQQDDYGISGNFTFRFENTYRRKEKIVADLTQGIAFLLKKHNVELIYGEAKLVSANEVAVGDEVYRGNNIIIATGSIPAVFPDWNVSAAITSDELLAMKEVPRKLAIIGGGVVGVEFASIFNAFGSEVEIFELAETILPMFDKEISRRLQSYLKTQGITIHTATKVLGLEEKGKIYYRTGGEDKMSVADRILVSVGRVPNVSGLNLEAAGVKYDRRGIRVNSRFQTNVKNIYAIGDVTGKMMLAHAAAYSGYHAVGHILGEKSRINFGIMPSCVFTFPEVAMVGLTESECARYEYRIHKALFRANGKALTMNDADGFIKIITVNNKIKGVHVIGPHASDLIHEAVIAMNGNITANRFAECIHAHPTLGEIYLQALEQ